jgi:DNA-binding YbaB/EbfC family protein
MPDFMKALQGFERMRTELQQMVLTGTSGGGMVTAEVSGDGQIKSIKIDPTVVNPADTEMLEDLIVVAVNEAQKKVQAATQEKMGALTGGLNLPFKLPF